LDTLSDYDYELPVERIAQTPLADRSASRLLHLDRQTGHVEHRAFTEIVDLLREGDLLVMNDTRVSAIRVFGHKPTGGQVEALLLREDAPGDYEALVKPGRRLPVGARIEFEEGLAAVVAEERPDGRKLLRFESTANLKDRLDQFGRAPLPPYIHAALSDRERYQTVYGSSPGSAAAPTAGLHFTHEIFRQLAERGVGTAHVTLHVGLDTFRPIQAENPADHPIHGETCVLSQETADRIGHTRGRIIAVGTTTVRTLESLAEGHRRVRAGSMNSRLFIRPGFKFQIVDGMFTNFHMPRTTMLMMISAMAGRSQVMNAYQLALAEKYRFLSFGDSMLIL